MAASSVSLLELLPLDLLLDVSGRLPKKARLAWRTSARQALRSFDASNTSLSLSSPPNSAAVLGLVRRTPRLTSLSVSAWRDEIDWRAVLSAAAGSLRSLKEAKEQGRAQVTETGGGGCVCWVNAWGSAYLRLSC